MFSEIEIWYLYPLDWTAWHVECEKDGSFLPNFSNLPRPICRIGRHGPPTRWMWIQHDKLSHIRKKNNFSINLFVQKTFRFCFLPLYIGLFLASVNGETQALKLVYQVPRSLRLQPIQQNILFTLYQDSRLVDTQRKYCTANLKIDGKKQMFFNCRFDQSTSIVFMFFQNKSTFI